MFQDDDKADLDVKALNIFIVRFAFTLPSPSPFRGKRRRGESISSNGARDSHQFEETHFCGVRVNWNGNDDEKKFAELLLFYCKICAIQKNIQIRRRNLLLH